MSLDPAAERASIHERYGALRGRDLVVYVVLLAMVVVASVVNSDNWFVLAALGVAFWEFTKFRLRRQCRSFRAPGGHDARPA
jgi:hypothetical protein